VFFVHIFKGSEISNALNRMQEVPKEEGAAT
jgi:hypothetical protein